MRNLSIVVLKGVIALSLAGSVFVQVVLLPLTWVDLSQAGVPPWGRVVLVSIAAAVVLTMQVFAICVWRLLTMVREGSVFSRGAFRYVDVIIGAIATAAALVVVLAVVLAPGDLAPGAVGLICGASLVLAGVALLVVVMRQLLVQAVGREVEARALRTELSEVI
ncbi:DUF2975 domain-containing protein [Kocuria coralli]|uniref:DUF2975 domain-containing protein n=1 Tax=Kocuria coralli TaxID=1461025 RepID=A0A5J5KXX8_9MICC|nr:DUF2975 domain-containing protein [Kocuria coralli]KAA9394504.1 DUF2975 domain-containing protein [Kocuria coralli]